MKDLSERKECCVDESSFRIRSWFFMASLLISSVVPWPAVHGHLAISSLARENKHTLCLFVSGSGWSLMAFCATKTSVHLIWVFSKGLHDPQNIKDKRNYDNVLL